MAQKFLATEEILVEFGLAELKITTTINEEEYRACRELSFNLPRKPNEVPRKKAEAKSTPDR